MPKGGHNRLPAEVKAARGTLQKCRTTPDAPKGVLLPVPEPPKGLTRAERAMWLELKPQVDSLRIYTSANETAFRTMVFALAATRDRGEASLTNYLNALRIGAAMLSRFGLDPASRDRVSVVGGQKDPAAEEVPIYGKPKLVAGSDGA